MSDPAVSVVMCVYNGERWLREAIGSVLAHPGADFEFVIVDDGSTDGSPEIIRSYRDERIRVVRQANQGLAAARNTGAREARGRYIAYIDADDVAEPQRLAVQSAFLNAHPDVAAVGCSVRIIDENGRLLLVQRVATGAALCRRRLFHGQFYNYGSSLMIRRDALREVGPFRTFFVQREDVDFMLRLAERFAIDNVPETLYRYRINTAGLTHQDLNVGLYYHEVAYALHRERLAGGNDRLQRGETIAPYQPRPGETPRPSDLRRVLTWLHLGEAELLREVGENWSAAAHLVRAVMCSPTSRGTIQQALRILLSRPAWLDAPAQA